MFKSFIMKKQKIKKIQKNRYNYNYFYHPKPSCHRAKKDQKTKCFYDFLAFF